ncbi:MAG: F0F1 ATP synthase subunit B [Clostridiales bacterium]|nr:F0F1 ATP synthase subunit B [Clostridiales bacterium]
MLDIDFWNIFWTIVNLVIFYLFAKKFLFGRILNVMEKRREMISGQFDSAKQKEEEAAALKEKYEGVMQSAGDESARMLQEAKKNADAQYNKIVKSAADEADRMVQDARKSIENERQAALRSVESDIAKIAMTAAEKIVEETNDPQQNKKMYDAFMDEVEQNDTDGD